ncbi:unnamed protein product [Pseudo-nitzschia multistriata]|uniref:Uncharacterized protein n=1 Tax=Pseudo-nitzschia multistriata TaxID=183589 RepID=A0A448ZKM7_9STRA|nr:unnamed protein product [Pseudo-nitzschia multistriata]
MPATKIKRLPTQVFIGAYQGVTSAAEIERIITDEEWDAQCVICTNMAICTKDIAGCTKIRELGNPAAMEAAASGAILGGLLGSMSQLMIGNDRPSVTVLAGLEEKDQALAVSKRPSVVARVAEHNITKMDKTRLKKVGDALVRGSSAIVCVFDEVLVRMSDYETNMKEHRQEMSDLTDHVTSKIHEQLRAGNDVAFHVVVDEATGEISWTRTVVGEDAIQVRDIVMSQDSFALEEVTTTSDGDGNETEVATETVVVTPEAMATARTLLRDSVCAYEISYEDLVDEPSDAAGAGACQVYEQGVVRQHAGGEKSVLYERATVAGEEKTYEQNFQVTTGAPVNPPDPLPNTA